MHGMDNRISLHMVTITCYVCPFLDFHGKNFLFSAETLFVNQKGSLARN